jgi:hypothetical protein
MQLRASQGEAGAGVSTPTKQSGAGLVFGLGAAGAWDHEAVGFPVVRGQVDDRLTHAVCESTNRKPGEKLGDSQQMSDARRTQWTRSAPAAPPAATPPDTTS